MDRKLQSPISARDTGTQQPGLSHSKLSARSTGLTRGQSITRSTTRLFLHAFIIENNRGSATYYIMITDRKNAKDSDDSEERCIGFATNHPTIKTEVYAKRWGIETGYGKIEESRTNTRITDMESRMLCFYYSLVLYNEWIILRAMLSDGTERQSTMTTLTFKVQLELHLMREPKPPT